MCVEIFKLDNKQSYKPELPFEEQVVGSKEVLIDCEPNCPKVTHFLDEVEKICKNGQYLPFNIKLADNSNFKLFKKVKKLNKEITTSDIISKMVLFHKNADDKLKELSDMCLKGDRE